MTRRTIPIVILLCSAAAAPRGLEFAPEPMLVEFSAHNTSEARMAAQVDEAQLVLASPKVPFRVRKTVAFLSLLAASAFAATTQDFLTAIREGDLAKLQELSRDQASVRLADSKGVTPLHYATVFGTPHAMKLLIDAGAVVNATDSLGAGALHWSACDPIKTKILLDHGAEVDLRTAQGRTPLMVAATCDGAFRRRTRSWSGVNHPKILDGLDESVHLRIQIRIPQRQATGCTPALVKEL